MKIRTKISFNLKIRYAVQILDFKFSLPKDSIFTEKKRFDFAKGLQKAEQFSTESKNLGTFEWKILKEGIYNLPEFFVKAKSFNDEEKILAMPEIEIIVSEKYQDNVTKKTEKDRILENAFERQEDKNQVQDIETYEKIAKNTKLSIFDKIFSKQIGIFKGGEIKSVPEEKSLGQKFTGGQKVKIIETISDWSLVKCKDFQGWTKNANIIEIK